MRNFFGTKLGNFFLHRVLPGVVFNDSDTLKDFVHDFNPLVCEFHQTTPALASHITASGLNVLNKR
jgi:hypothetical protein